MRIYEFYEQKAIWFFWVFTIFEFSLIKIVRGENVLSDSDYYKFGVMEKIKILKLQQTVKIFLHTKYDMFTFQLYIMAQTMSDIFFQNFFDSVDIKQKHNIIIVFFTHHTTFSIFEKVKLYVYNLKLLLHIVEVVRSIQLFPPPPSMLQEGHKTCEVIMFYDKYL